VQDQNANGERDYASLKREIAKTMFSSKGKIRLIDPTSISRYPNTMATLYTSDTYCLVSAMQYSLQQIMLEKNHCKMPRYQIIHQLMS